MLEHINNELLYFAFIAIRIQMMAPKLMQSETLITKYEYLSIVYLRKSTVNLICDLFLFRLS